MLNLNNYHNELSTLFDDPQALQQRIETMADFPEEITQWLGRLMLLHGIPINYLVPDESMLPPESIRFFYLDPDWIEALVDGALSIGRNPIKDMGVNALARSSQILSKSVDFNMAKEKVSRSVALDKALKPILANKSRQAASNIRTRYLGLNQSEVTSRTISASSLNTTVIDTNMMQNVSGFLLRSSIVRDYPGLGVIAYPQGHPSLGGYDISRQLNIIRLEKLHAQSDTIMCFIQGDAYRIDIHEAPEALHYGLDGYSNGTGEKTVYRFTKNSSNKITIMKDNPSKKVDLNQANGIIRDEDPRTINMKALSQKIGQTIGKTGTTSLLDAAEVGFEMTEGVSMISFLRKI